MLSRSTVAARAAGGAATVARRHISSSRVSTCMQATTTQFARFGPPGAVCPACMEDGRFGTDPN